MQEVLRSSSRRRVVLNQPKKVQSFFHSKSALSHAELPPGFGVADDFEPHLASMAKRLHSNWTTVPPLVTPAVAASGCGAMGLSESKWICQQSNLSSEEGVPLTGERALGVGSVCLGGEFRCDIPREALSDIESAIYLRSTLYGSAQDSFLPIGQGAAYASGVAETQVLAYSWFQRAGAIDLMGFGFDREARETRSISIVRLSDSAITKLQEKGQFNYSC